MPNLPWGLTGVRTGSAPPYPYYAGTREAEVPTVYKVFATGSMRLTPTRSQAARNHSPDGFEWGYGGSGPAQLSLALLIDVTDDTEISLRLYQRFKFAVVGHMPSEWQMGAMAIMAWVQQIETEEAGMAAGAVDEIL